MIFGLLTRWALTLGGLLIAVLIFGTALRSDWSTAGVQMVYAIKYYSLLKNLADNYFPVDTLGPAYRKPLTIRSTAAPGGRAQPVAAPVAMQCLVRRRIEITQG